MWTFIGDGEAEKASTLLSLKTTESSTACPIGVDDRTIGIELSECTPFPSETPFSAWFHETSSEDRLCMQSCNMLMSRRALHPLLWRVRESLDVSRFDPALRCEVCQKVLVVPSGQQFQQQHQQQQSVYR
jgi:hypothetical protein